MTKTELIAEVASKSEITKVSAESVVNAVIDTIMEQIAVGNKVQIVGFGGFERVERAERQGRDPRSNTPITISASRVPKFKASKNFKEITNK